MSYQDTIDHLLDHYESPRHHGAFEDADIVVRGGQSECGDTITIYLKVDATGQQIERLSFEGQGCSVSQAAASILLEMVQGASFEQVTDLSPEGMIDILGRDVVRSRPRCATLALGTLQTAIAKYRATRTAIAE